MRVISNYQLVLKKPMQGEGTLILLLAGSFWRLIVTLWSACFELSLPRDRYRTY